MALGVVLVEYLRAILSSLLVAEPFVPAINSGQGLLEKTFKLLLEDVRRCCAYKLLGDAAGGVLFRGCLGRCVDQ